MLNQQRGGTLVGFIMGLVVGMTVALGVAVYVTKVPIPFMNKGMTRSAEQDAAEEKKNKDWDPNAPLYGKNPAKAADKADAAPETPKPDVKADVKPVAKPVESKPDAAVKVDPKSADPLGDLAKAKADLKVAEPKTAEAKAADAKSAPAPMPVAADPFIYFVQAGAYRTPEEADAQRAKMSLLALDAKVSERDQGGRTVYRVRVGPLDKIEAERVRAKLEAAHLDSAMVRVQR
ncbi:SPOR domain-containing protein [Limnohabitans sp.]|uniref:SPOR domain-containing protein n=1 Tax=Limnohabitans sp. TaxID=1907725 RepID=UPI00286F7CA9|nr:SPOR domain-containing protein [Limnohabitans sp.]